MRSVPLGSLKCPINLTHSTQLVATNQASSSQPPQTVLSNKRLSQLPSTKVRYPPVTPNSKDLQRLSN